MKCGLGYYTYIFVIFSKKNYNSRYKSLPCCYSEYYILKTILQCSVPLCIVYWISFKKNLLLLLLKIYILYSNCVNVSLIFSNIWNQDVLWATTYLYIFLKILFWLFCSLLLLKVFCCVLGAWIFPMQD